MTCAFFVQAVDAGGFAAAGRRLGRPKSTVSKRVAELEAALSVRLVHRSARRFVLTDVGQDFYLHARAAMIEADAAESAVHKRLAEPSGIVNVTASVPTAQFRLADQLPRLALEHPRVQVRLHVTDRFVDLVQEGFDIAVRSHFAPLPDSDLVQRQIRTEPIVLVASPDYLAQRGTPRSPEDSAPRRHRLLGAPRRCADRCALIIEAWCVLARRFRLHLLRNVSPEMDCFIRSSHWPAPGSMAER
jgi:DNA-binding transcriptional LysR family regulator